MGAYTPSFVVRLVMTRILRWTYTIIVDDISKRHCLLLFGDVLSTHLVPQFIVYGLDIGK